MGEKPLVFSRIRIKNFSCVRQVDLRLTKLHAFVGPNDSGKSTLLRAIAAAKPDISKEGQWLRGEWHVGTFDAPSVEALVKNIWKDLSNKGVRKFLRLDPDVMRLACELLPTTETAPWFVDDKGQGLAGLYDALLSRDRKTFIELEEKFRELFPTVSVLQLNNTEQHKKSLGITLGRNTQVRAEEMSEGMLYWLAFAILEHLYPVGMLLIEEPENGLHPSRIREVMRVLRKVSERTQIALATHSPLVINELAPEEVTIVTRSSAQGTICTPITQTKNFQERSEVYALGELWLSYADGDLEKELVGDGSAPAKE